MWEEGDVPGGLCGSGRPAALGGHHDEDGDGDDDDDDDYYDDNDDNGDGDPEN